MNAALHSYTDQLHAVEQARARTARHAGFDAPLPVCYVARVPAWIVAPGAPVPRPCLLCDRCLAFADDRATLARATDAEMVQHGGCSGCGLPTDEMP